MTQNYKKKLIEVAIPLEKISSGCAYEKMPGIGPHPRGIHHWWAKRPHVACRSILFAQLVDDPTSHPDKFPTEEDCQSERARLFNIIERLADWKNSQNEALLTEARNEILKSCDGKLPDIYDPFSGGYSITSEAQRLGLPAYGSDLNPVAVLIGKGMIEIPTIFKDTTPVHPGGSERNHYRNAEGLAEDVKYYGNIVLEEAKKRIGHLYPKVLLPKEYGGREATVIAWIWSRTVPSPNPAYSDVMVPIATSFLLSSKKGKESWIEPVIDKHNKTIIYRIRRGGTAEELKKAKLGTKAGRGASFNCVFSNTAITPDYVKEKGKSGEMAQALIAIVAEGKGGRVYLEPSREHEEIALSANPDWKPLQKQPPNPRWFSPPDYGMESFGDLFTNRQLVALNTFCDELKLVIQKIERDALSFGFSPEKVHLRDGGKTARSYAEAVSVLLSFAINRCADFNNSIAGWNQSNEKVMHLFGRQAVPMTWDFGEANPIENVVGGFETAVIYIAKCIERLHPSSTGVAFQHDAQTVVYSQNSVISTDPPYYDNIGYADLSDFFYAWSQRCIKDIFPDIFSVMQTPKGEELVATPYRHGGKKQAEDFFLSGMTLAIKRMAKYANPEFPLTIYYAFKQSEIEKEGLVSTGWATFLQAIINSNLEVNATWPVRSEQTYRMVASGTNALANSVVLVCRKKEATAEIISRAEFIRLLKRELPPAIAELQAANIAPADMPQSAIGPGMGVFSRYKAVLESDDSPMSVKTALQLINHELDEFLNDIKGEFDSNTRFAITWFEQNGMDKGEYGIANSIAQARGTSVESVKHAGIVESAAGKVRILKRDELSEDWDPETDKHVTIWECCQHLIRTLEKDGEYEAALLLKKIGSEKAEAVKDLAYCLYDICSNKRKDAKEATSYNALIAIWTDLTRLAATIHDTRGDGQLRMQV